MNAIARRPLWSAPASSRDAGLPVTPTFEQFAAVKEQLLDRAPELLNLSETRMASTLAPWVRSPESLEMPAEGYRCHVAEEWLACFNLPAGWKPRALVTQGVRHSLKCLLASFAAQSKRVLLPSDVYPVYLTLARETECTVATYESVTATGLASAVSDQVDIIIVCEPFKPRGSAMSGLEREALARWLAGGRHRRLVVDAVYLFGVELPPTLLSLVASDQVVVLHSLSKGWARPLAAGIALVPQQDVAVLTPVFREQAVDKEGLRLAQGLLSGVRAEPMRLAGVLERKHHTLQAVLRSRAQRPCDAFEAVWRRPNLDGQYLFLVQAPWLKLLAQHGVLALPHSTFGGTSAQLSVVSTLTMAPHAPGV
jgi:aspartate/methionine/tyrosine aminotransferase